MSVPLDGSGFPLPPLEGEGVVGFFGLPWVSTPVELDMGGTFFEPGLISLLEDVALTLPVLLTRSPKLGAFLGDVGRPFETLSIPVPRGGLSALPTLPKTLPREPLDLAGTVVALGAFMALEKMLPGL